LLITAALGAMVLAHKEHVVPRLSQRDLARRRFSSDHPFPLPGPGVFAAGDSIARGALLPDGTVTEASLAPTLLELDKEDEAP
jgi:NADH-quinone oxidoreductase subunit J